MKGMLGVGCLRPDGKGAGGALLAWWVVCPASGGTGGTS